MPPEFNNIFSSTSAAVPSSHAGETHLDAALRRDHDLIRAIDDAGSLHDRLVHSQGLCGGRCYATLLSLDEPDLRHRLTKDVLNFYPRDGIQPFVPLAARGPWIVTSHGAIVYDAAGYGMTGFGHSPDNLLAGEFIFISVQAIRMTSCFVVHSRRQARGHGQRHDELVRSGGSHPRASPRDRPQMERRQGCATDDIGREGKLHFNSRIGN